MGTGASSSVIDRGKHSVLGVNIDAVDYEMAVERILSAAAMRQPFAVSALAVHGVMTGYTDEEHRARLNHLDLVVPDGQPVRWALNLLHGAKLNDRVYGPNLTLKVCERAAREGIGMYLYGSTEPVLNRLSVNLCERFQGLIISGAEPSKFRRLTADEKHGVIDRIRNSGAEITLVGLGCPRQEVWAYEYREPLSMPILAVGAAFDFHAGTTQQAPGWMQKHGLEWAFRLSVEPRRLWRRYLLLNPWFAFLIATQLTGFRRFNQDWEDQIKEISYG